MRINRLTFLFSILVIWLLSPSHARAGVSNNPSDGPLSFQDRIKYQRAIEEVYWRHRIWPKENPGPKPPLEKILPDSAIISKVEDYLRKSNALEQYWNRPITSEQLQAEVDRIVKNTQQPGLLKEIFSALNNDAYLIAECLARPLIVDRFVHSSYSFDERYHGMLKAKAQSELRLYSTVANMKSLSGDYLERVLEKNDEKGTKEFNTASSDTILLDASEWENFIQLLRHTFEGETGRNKIPKLSMMPTYPKVKPSSGPVLVNQLSVLQEDADQFFVTAILYKDESKVRLATVEWKKISFEEWWKGISASIPSDIVAPSSIYNVLSLNANTTPCPDDTWKPLLTVEARSYHTAIWTGSEMIVWGGFSLINTGDRYNPATDTWASGGVSLENAPEPRSGHTAVWTGSEMIVWGGGTSTGVTDTGGRYNPSNDTWAPNGTSLTDAPDLSGHTAVWTGSEMIVWGGGTNTGGRYNPSNDTWAPGGISTVNAPSPRTSNTAVWTGTEMIVWGGLTNYEESNTGGRYNPFTDSWAQGGTSAVNVPTERVVHTAIWTGTEMIIWGGTRWVGESEFLGTGGKYNPSTNSWASDGTSMVNAPPGRRAHTAVWTGNEMIIWGGFLGYGSPGGPTNTGGRYDPATDSWVAQGVSSVNAPPSRDMHTAIWTGTEIIVWGGGTNTGGRYYPSTDTWLPGGTATGNVPHPRTGHTALWIGTEMIIWGGYTYLSPPNSGGRYDPTTDTWSANGIAETNAPPGKNGTAIWNGTEMIVWGGFDDYGRLQRTGGRYNPSTDTWEVGGISTLNAPSERYLCTAIWTGTKMIIWGGQNTSVYLKTGGLYDPSTDTWSPYGTSMMNAPSERTRNTAIWTGHEMIVWGGQNSAGSLNTGGRYNPSDDIWAAGGTNLLNAPSERYLHTAIWTGSEMIIWGPGNTGGRYDPTNDSWVPTSTLNAPTDLTHGPTAIWTGAEMIVWGGGYGYWLPSIGGRYYPLTDTWSANGTSIINAPTQREGHSAIWTGTEMIIFGGGALDAGGRYCGASASLSISDVSVEEGKKGSKTFKFVVTLSNPVDSVVKVDYSTADGTATEMGNDYIAKSGTKRIGRGKTMTTIKIKVKGDKISETDETFTVNLTNAVGAGIFDPQGIGTIMSDD